MVRSVTCTTLRETLLVRNATVVFEPNTFDGNDSPRKNIVLEVDGAALETVRVLEADIAMDKLSSAMTQYGLTAKIQTDSVKVWRDHVETELPPNLKQVKVDACIQIKAIWQTEQMSGLSLVVTDLNLIDDEPALCPF